ncbi:putative membrane protein [Teredinibacter turnerae T7901]|uniref:Membrane protein n=1 Tax=Teredinibacter turnerae (strain ATCC 39867 / T7901) TaxID=377629 RepID=C5BNT3_TERTT|nr:hypothetical protein [Teredinibacter turnerae]ACR13183.1 putative membrane protein [Teredinibacter turnerae T7901]
MRQKPAEDRPLRIKLDFASLNLGLALGIALIAIATLPHFNRLPERYLSVYGQSLATMAAAQAIEPTFKNDLISQQAILREVMGQPKTLLATIHDVEHHLVVQAGDSRSLDAHLNEAYTAPILLHNNIAGYLSVHLAVEKTGAETVFVIAVLGSVLLAAFSLWQLQQQGRLLWPALPRARKASPPLDVDNAPQAQEDDTEELESNEPRLVYAIIHIKNLRVLQQQLNADNFRKTLLAVEHTISDVLALYGGDGFEWRQNLVELRFLANDAEDEALFRAVCSAWLIVELCSIVNTIPLDLAALVSANHQDLTPSELQISGLVLETQAANDELISRRLQLLELGAEGGRMIVADIVQPYRTLLEKQRSQLAQL